MIILARRQELKKEMGRVFRDIKVLVDKDILDKENWFYVGEDEKKWIMRQLQK